MTVEATSSILTQKFNTAKQARRRFERDWKLNLSFFLGRSWVVYLPGMNKVVDWRPPNNKPLHSTNLVQPVVRAEYAKVTQNRPTFRVNSFPGKPDAVDKAKACKHFLDYKWTTGNWSAAFNHALLWALICTTGFVKTYFDPDAGQEVEDPEEGGSYRWGDIALDFCSPFEWFFDPFARTKDEATWAFHARVRSQEYVQDKYGEKVPADSMEGLQVAGLAYGAREAQRQEGSLPAVVLKEYWEVPNKKNPYGKYIVQAGNKILLEQENPYYDICPIPVEMMRHIVVPDQFYGDCTVTQLRPINVQYNRLYTDMLENSLKLSNPPLIAPVNSIINPPKWEPGEIIYTNPILGGRIDQIKVEPYPAQVINTLRRILEARDDISNMSDVSRGEIPRGTRAAQTLAYMLEQDQSRMAGTVTEYETMISKALTNLLRLARKFCTVPQLIPIMGENNMREIRLFKAEDIPPDADVQIEQGSSLQRSVVQQQELLMNYWDRGIITDPRILLRLTQYGSDQELTTDLELDSQQAKRENDKMALGQAVQVEDFQNHFVHLTEHSRYMKTAEFEELPEENKQLFREHFAQTRQIVQQIQAPKAPISNQGGVVNAQKGRFPGG